MPRYIVQLSKSAPKLDITPDDVESIVANYGESLLVNASEEQIEEIQEQGFRVRELADDPGVKVNNYRLNTSMNVARARRSAEPAPANAEAAAFPDSVTSVVVRMAGPIHPDWAVELEAMGATIFTSLGNHAHLVRITANGVAELEAMNFVMSVSDYSPQLKVSEKLMTSEVHGSFTANAALTLEGDMAEAQSMQPESDLLSPQTMRQHRSDTPGNIRVVLFDKDDAAAAIARLQAMNLSVVENQGDSLIVAARANKLSEIASITEVRSIEPNSPNVLHNRVATGITRADELQTSGLDGEGQIVAVCDTGLDTGDATTVSADFNGRTRAIHAFGRPGLANDPNGHGTHVAGSVLGNGTNSNGNVRGIAPAAELVFQSVMDAGGGLGGLANLENVFQRAFDEGARIHNNSWGALRSNGDYRNSSSITDSFAFEHRDFLIVVSAGNDFPLRVTAPGTAKNCLTVGASESLQRLPATVSFPSSPRFPMGASLSGVSAQADNINDIARFSSNGPVQGNRRKPDVVAPGSWILSARSTVMVADTGPDGLSGLPTTPVFPNGGTGDEDGVATHDEAVGLGLPGQPIRFAGNVNTPPMPPGSGAGSEELYMYQSGTSMAAPITAGCCALVRQQVMQSGHAPSAALIKAMIVNGGGNIGVQVPANDQGWGRVDLVQTITQGGSPVFFDDDINNAVGSFAIREYEAVVADPGEPVTVTLVWRDPAGPNLQNRLHLRVFDGNNPAATSDPLHDILNNVQKVILNSVGGSTLRIEVEGVDVTRGIPERPAQFLQDFALVVGNASSLDLQ